MSVYCHRTRECFPFILWCCMARKHVSTWKYAHRCIGTMKPMLSAYSRGQTLDLGMLLAKFAAAEVQKWVFTLNMLNMSGSAFVQWCLQPQAPILVARYQDVQCGVLGRLWAPAAWQRSGRCCRWGGGQAEVMAKVTASPLPTTPASSRAASDEHSTWVSLSSAPVQAWSAGGKRREHLFLRALTPPVMLPMRLHDIPLNTNPWVEPEEIKI